MSQGYGDGKNSNPFSSPPSQDELMKRGLTRDQAAGYQYQYKKGQEGNKPS